MISDIDLYKQKTVPELFAETLMGDVDDEAPWDAVWTLIKIDKPEVLETALEFCNSEEPLKRVRGLNVLAQFGCFSGNPNGPYLDKRIAIALEHLSDKSEMVVESAAWALSHMKGESAKNGLLTLRHNANADIRHAVAVGLAGETANEAIDALIELMQDPIDYVRDWATYSLGRQPVDDHLLDSPKIRRALHGRLNDEDEDVRSEAIWGLAIRKDPVGLQMLLERLEADEWVSGDESASQYLLDSTNDAPIADLRDGLRGLLADIGNV